MSGGVVGVIRTMPRRKSTQPRDRFDLRIEPDWLDRIERQADRIGVSVSAYIRMATSQRLELDEASDPTLKDKPRKS
jgi:predicted HicB family RNase H-like nuclease